MRRRSIEAPNGPRLLFVDTGSGTGLELRLGTQLVAQCLLPVSALVAEDGRREWRRSGYSECSAGANGMSARGELRASGSRIVFRDRYSIQADQIKVTRNVDVEGDSPGCGFLSALEWDLDRASLDDPWFAPGVWHGTNDNVPTYAIGAPETRLMRDTVVFREDRLTLPFLLHYDTARRIVFSFSRLEADGQTVEADDDDEPCIDGELRFGSFGMIRHGTGVAFWYPGTEGEISYPPLWTLGRGNDQTDSSVNPFQRKNATAGSRSWSYRFHPLHDRFHHGFSLRLDCRHAPQFFAACDAHWRSLSAAYRPRVLAADLERVERTSVDLLASMTTRVGEVSGIPTWIDCFTGTPGKLQNTFGIGFVSRNAEAALLLLDYGHRWGDAAMIARGGEILDFWTMRSGYGLSHTEYDPYAGAWVDASDGGSPCVYLRDQSESRRSCLQAWQIEETRGVSHPLWLQWAKSYGDWLLSHQELAGGFKRAYRLDGTAISTNPSDCSHVIPFLLALGRATGASVYSRLAISTAHLVWDRYHSRRIFVGGTLDNPNCTDKEAAALALEAYLALFEATGSRRWLHAAEEAARVCETWIFQWNIQMPPGRFFPAGRTTVGFQLITAGFSAFDMYLTRHVGEFARLARYTRDFHYREVAKILLHNTKCTVQLENEYGYVRPGMQIEHWSTGRGRGYGLNSGWLPWVTTSHLISINAARMELPGDF